jgi:tRNA-dihydrouridine synthase A
MMDWTDRHCRFLHRLLSRRATLYTEMVTAPAIRFGDRDRLIGFDACEHPVIQQVGGSDPAELAEAARIVESYGYDGIDLNCGCPSDRVQSGAFGACLMAEPDTVARCVAAMKEAVDIPVSVKCRIGIDEQDPAVALPRFLDAVIAAGADHVTVHARKAWLKGLSPKENRSVPPLDYGLVHAEKRRRPDVPMAINGGILTLADAAAHLEVMDGVMLGRAAYETPVLLADVDRLLFGDETPAADFDAIVDAMIAYGAAHVAAGGRIGQVTRHMLGLVNARPGARLWRQILTVEAAEPEAGPEVIDKARRAVHREAEAAAGRLAARRSA